MFGKLFRKRGKGRSGESEDDDDDDNDRDDDSQDDPSNPPQDDDSPAMRVRLEGVSDVRPVGEGLAPSGGQADGGAGAGAGGKPPAATAGGEANTAEAANSNVEPEAPAENGSGGGGSGALDLDLKDIFEEESNVDKALKDLAESQEDVLAQDLATDLINFLAELQR